MMRIFLCAIALLWSSSVQAHPHIWVYTGVEVLEKNGLIQGVQVHWNFDELYSASFLEDADTNGNGLLEEAETEETIRGVFEENPENLFPFMYFVMQGKKPTFSLKNPKIWMAEDETLHYTFGIIFDEPQTVAGRHEIAFFDPEFYVSFEQDLDMKIPESFGCSQKLRESKTVTVYDGLVHPEIYLLNCEGKK